MNQSPRLEVVDGLYHVNSGGSNGRDIFVDDDDRSYFYDLLGRVVARHRWIVYAWCLMSNHYHLVIANPFGGLSTGMKHLNGGFSRATNRRHGWNAHLFRNRFFGRFVKDETHLLQSCRYVVLNPVRAGLCDHPREWKWSSYSASAGDEPPPAFFALGKLLELFAWGRGDVRIENAIRSYTRYVGDGMDGES